MSEPTIKTLSPKPERSSPSGLLSFMTFRFQSLVVLLSDFQNRVIHARYLALKRLENALNNSLRLITLFNES